MKKGFTLAEVLITLGIIGVVAALTLPSLIQNYKEQATVTRVKKFYSVFSQAYAMAVQENGTLDNWGLKNSELYEDDDGNKIHTDESLEQSDKFLIIMSKYLNNAGYQKLHNTKGEEDTENTGYVLADGTQIVGIWLQPENCNDASDVNAYCGDFYIKTDNKEYLDEDKNFRPNIFAFRIEPNRIWPYGTDDATFKYNCLNGKNYSRCTGWVIANENMDYLHCDDLSINGKTKCR